MILQSVIDSFYLCFNRYMVECEFFYILAFFRSSPVLIDTWWNVNSKIISIKLSIRFSFNRYMVECEYYYLILKLITPLSFNRYMVECEFNTDT